MVSRLTYFQANNNCKIMLRSSSTLDIKHLRWKCFLTSVVKSQPSVRTELIYMFYVTTALNTAVILVASLVVTGTMPTSICEPDTRLRQVIRIVVVYSSLTAVAAVVGTRNNCTTLQTRLKR